METTKEKVQKARGSLFLNYPFFGSILLKLHLEECDWIPTLATNGVTIYYNAKFVESLDYERLRTALAHEAMHVALGHPMRHGMFIKNYRNFTGPELDKYTAKMNMAFDYAINPLLVDSGRTEIKGWLYDDNYRGLSAEEIYLRLPEPPEMHYHVIQIGSNGEPKPSQGQGDGDGAKDCPVCKAGGSKDQSGKPCGGLLPHPASGGTDAQKAQAEADRRSMIAEACAIAKQCGKMPGGLEDLIDGLLNPRVDWVDQLRRFIEISAKSDYNWMQPNKRYMGSGFVLPTLANKETGTIVVAIDTSGSIGNDLLEQFASEISSMLELVRPEKIIVLHADAAVNNVEEFEPGDLPIKLHVIGRGGTDFNPVFDWIAENEIHPICMVYLTDLFGPYPDTQPDYPVLWCIEPSGDKNDPRWGEIIRM